MSFSEAYREFRNNINKLRRQLFWLALALVLFIINFVVMCTVPARG